jgi:CRISPR-associated protein Csm1
MSIQIFLQAKLRGIEEFLLAPGGELPGRSGWVVLLSEVLPRALLAELGLARILLGSATSGQFLVVLPQEAREPVDGFLAAARAEIRELTGGRLELLWAVTENLGEWSMVRRRLAEEMQRQIGATLAGVAGDWIADGHPPVNDAYFAGFGRRLRDAHAVGWSPENPARVLVDSGKHSWSIGGAADGIAIARHGAPDDEGSSAASVAELASRAEGRPLWGMLRGDVDGFAVRARRADTIEEHVQLSVLYKQFFIGELEVACSMPEFWRKVSILYCGGDDFAVYGSWDALLPLAREIERLFHRFCEESLKDLAGPEAKTMSMALALGAPGDPLPPVFEEAGRRLEAAKSSAKDSFHVFGRAVEWKQLGQAAEMKDGMMRLIHDFRCSPAFLGELEGFYREREPARAFDRPWRYHRRFNTVVGSAGGRDFQRLRARLITELIGRNPAQVKLRPAGRVAAEWARLSIKE